MRVFPSSFRLSDFVSRTFGAGCGGPEFPVYLSYRAQPASLRCAQARGKVRLLRHQLRDQALREAARPLDRLFAARGLFVHRSRGRREMARRSSRGAPRLAGAAGVAPRP